jgi:hypothetical protein
MARCRCGAKASTKCGTCGCELNDSGICQRHPAVNVAAIRCLHCARPLCFWHYALQPTVGADDRTKLGQVCFPSCAHAFQKPEWRPAA